MRALMQRLTYANVVSTLALFLVLTGGAVFAAGKVGSAEIARDAVRSKHIRTGAVGQTELGPGSVATGALAAAAVTAEKLSADSVGTGAIAAGAVTEGKLAPNSVTEGKLAPNSVGPAALQGNAVNSDQLAPDSVGTRELKTGAVEAENLANGVVSPRLFAHVNSSGVLAEQSGVVSAGRLSKGQYVVEFRRSLVGCVGVASVGFGFGPGVIGAGATAQVRMNYSNDAAKVGVTIYRKGYTFNDVEDNDFHLIIAC